MIPQCKECHKIHVEFKNVKKDILESIKERTNIHEAVHLMEGFVNYPLDSELTKKITIGGETVPMVMLLGQESGQIYLFALKALIDYKE